MHFLVTGANGLVGSRLVKLLANRGHQVTAVARQPLRAPKPGITGVLADLSHAARLSQVVNEARPDVVINPAAMTDVDGCEKDPSGAWAANAEGPAILAKASRAV